MRTESDVATADERDTAGWRFFTRHVRLLQANDVDALLAAHYTEDAQLISVDGYVRGRDALSVAFISYLDSIGSFTVEIDRFSETQDCILFEATMHTEKAGVRRVYDAFVFRDGKVSHQFTGLLRSQDAAHAPSTANGSQQRR